MTISIFDQGDYRTATRSAVLPILSAERLAHFLTASRESLSHEWFQTLSDWAREQRPPQ